MALLELKVLSRQLHMLFFVTLFTCSALVNLNATANPCEDAHSPADEPTNSQIQVLTPEQKFNKLMYLEEKLKAYLGRSDLGDQYETLVNVNNSLQLLIENYLSDPSSVQDFDIRLIEMHLNAVRTIGHLKSETKNDNPISYPLLPKDNPASLEDDTYYQIQLKYENSNEPRGANLQLVTFTPNTLNQLPMKDAEDLEVLTSFFDAIESGFINREGNDKGIRRLVAGSVSDRQGRKWSLVEVRLKQPHGKHRLFGYMDGTALLIVRYASSSHHGGSSTTWTDNVFNAVTADLRRRGLTD